MGAGERDQRASRDAFEVLDLIVAKRLARGLTTVVDSTGLDPKRRAGWRALAAEHAVPAFAVAFDTPAADVRARNRAREAPVPANVVAAQLREFAALALADEGFAPSTRRRRCRSCHRRSSPRSTAPRASARIPRCSTSACRSRGSASPAIRRRRRGRSPRSLAPPRRAGFTSLWVMDHFLQIPQVGREWEDMLESYTTLGYLAGVTERIRLGTLVTGITYRNLAHLAKIVATLDVLSGGRALCGLGAAWFEREHELYGWGMQPRADRYELLEDGRGGRGRRRGVGVGARAVGGRRVGGAARRSGWAAAPAGAPSGPGPTVGRIGAGRVDQPAPARQPQPAAGDPAGELDQPDQPGLHPDRVAGGAAGHLLRNGDRSRRSEPSRATCRRWSPATPTRPT